MFEVVQWLRRGLFPQKEKPKCLCCGKCCESFGGHLQASKADLQRWRQLGRDDLLSRVNRLGWIWVDPQTQKPVGRCPFLIRTDAATARCEINEVKPDICRAYPTLAHSRRCLRGVLLGLVLTFSCGLFGESPLSRSEVWCEAAEAPLSVRSLEYGASHPQSLRRSNRRSGSGGRAARRRRRRLDLGGAAPPG